MTTPASRSRDPLHGVTLETIVTKLHQRHGWQEMFRRIPVRCFQLNPSIKSSLTFLRKTPWARKRIEDWFVFELPDPSAAQQPEDETPPHVPRVVRRRPLTED